MGREIKVNGSRKKGIKQEE